MKRIVNIDIDTFEGVIPPGEDLIIFEKGETDASNANILYGFDEVGDFDHLYKNPTYGFTKTIAPPKVKKEKVLEQKRFTFDGDFITDTITGKKTEVPLFAWKATLKALNNLFD